jgi:hypothetical protein
MNNTQADIHSMVREAAGLEQPAPRQQRQTPSFGYSAGEELQDMLEDSF